MQPFTREGQNNSEENLNIAVTRPFTYENGERKSDELVVEVICPKNEIAEAEDSQESKSKEPVKPFKVIDPLIASYAQNVCRQYVGESSAEFEHNIARVLQEQFDKEGVILQNLVSCEHSRLLNFNLNLMKKIVRVQDTENGEKRKYEYQIDVQVTQRNGMVKDFNAIVPGEKVKKISWVTRATKSLATIPSDKDGRLEWNEKVQCCIENENVPIEIIYPNAGWREVAENTWRFVFTDGVIGYENLDVHTVPKYNILLEREKIGTVETFELAMKMIQETQNSVALELFLFTHMGVMSTLFDRAGFPLKFVLGVVGVTNSRKTSLVLALSQIYGREKFLADAEFATATRCGIEKTLSTYKDGVVIIDDFKPGIHNGQQNELNRKLDELVRMNGDRVPKKRMTDFLADGENKYFPIGGGCVLTMELVTGVTSSITRMFLTELGKDDVQNDQLSFFQENRWVLDTHLYDFILWVTSHFVEVINYLSNRIPQLRSERLYTIGRYDEMRSYFVVTAELFSKYARERNFWGDVECTSFQSYVKTAIEEEIFAMQAYIRKVDKGIWILRALDEMLKRGQLQAKELNEDTCVLRCEIYDSKEILYVKASSLFVAVKSYLLRTYSSIDLVSADEMISALERLEAIDIAVKADGRRERSRKLPIQRGNTIRYLYIRKNKMFEALEKE